MSDTPVTFNMPDGSVVSNDPRYYAQLQREQVEAQAAAALVEDVELGDALDWSHMRVVELRDEAVARGLDVTGLRKRSEFIALLNEPAQP